MAGCVPAVLGANDGIVSTAGGEFVSVHAQADTENADPEREQGELRRDPEGERRELAGIYVGRGLDPALADLASLGAVSAQIGGARVAGGTWRVAFWGAVAMAVTAGAGALFGAVA